MNLISRPFILNNFILFIVDFKILSRFTSRVKPLQSIWHLKRLWRYYSFITKLIRDVIVILNRHKKEVSRVIWKKKVKRCKKPFLRSAAMAFIKSVPKKTMQKFCVQLYVDENSVSARGEWMKGKTWNFVNASMKIQFC